MTDLAIAIHHWLEVIALYAIRPMVMLGVMPATDDPMLTVTARFQLGLVFATFCALGASPEDLKALNLQSMFILLFREAMIGLAMGFTAGKIFWVAQALGAYVDNLVGYNNVQLMNPSSSEQSTPMADLLLQLCTAFFYAMGGLLLLFELLVQSWKWWPVLGSEGPTWPRWHGKNISEGMDNFMSLLASVASPLLFLFTVLDIAWACYRALPKE